MSMRAYQTCGHNRNQKMEHRRVLSEVSLRQRRFICSCALTAWCVWCARWQRAAEAVAADQGLEREAAAQLARAGSLGSADATARLVAQLLPRAQGGPGGVAAALLPRVVERCAEHGALWNNLFSPFIFCKVSFSPYVKMLSTCFQVLTYF